MPDPSKQTVSATQISALFNVNPYTTRWMLYQQFIGNIPDEIADSRMSWGSKMQPLLLAQAAEDLKLEVIPNASDTYIRRGLLGCTRDATIICPDRGPGALETKCVFDYRTWMADYGGGSFVPKHHELQIQTQMFVGELCSRTDGPPCGEPDKNGWSCCGSQNRQYQWGVIAVWVAGEMHYFERKPIPDLWPKMEEAAKQFLFDVGSRREPEPFGASCEVPWLVELFPCERGKVIDLSEDYALAETAVMYRQAKEQEAGGRHAAAPYKAKLLAAAKDAEKIVLPEGIRVMIRPHGKGKRVTVYQPQPGEPIPEDLLMAG